MCYWGHYPEIYLAVFEIFFPSQIQPVSPLFFAAAEELPEWVSHHNNYEDQKCPDGSFRLLRQIRYAILGISSQ